MEDLKQNVEIIDKVDTIDENGVPRRLRNAPAWIQNLAPEERVKKETLLRRKIDFRL
jgi:hypothetical protein